MRNTKWLRPSRVTGRRPHVAYPKCQNKKSGKSENGPTFDSAELLCEDTRCWAGGQNLELSRAKPNMIGQATDILESIKTPTIERPHHKQRTEKQRDVAKPPEKFDKLTPTARTMAISQGSAPGRPITDFCDRREQLNIHREVQGAIRSVASGFNCYLRFRNAMGAPAFPITQETFSRRGAAFNPGKTYGLYVEHLRKDDLMLGNEPTWNAAEIRAIAKGLVNAKDRSSACSNFIQ